MQPVINDNFATDSFFDTDNDDDCKWDGVTDEELIRQSEVAQLLYDLEKRQKEIDDCDFLAKPAPRVSITANDVFPVSIKII